MSLPLAVALLIAGTAAAQAQVPAGMKGEWSRGDGAVRARVADCGKRLCMTNSWVRDSSGDEKVGDSVVVTMKERGDAKVSGSGFDPKRKLNLTVEMSVSGDSLNTRGCVVGGLVCRSVNWTRFR